jgi:hypothetical protein
MILILGLKPGVRSKPSGSSVENTLSRPLIFIFMKSGFTLGFKKGSLRSLIKSKTLRGLSIESPFLFFSLKRP